MKIEDNKSINFLDLSIDHVTDQNFNFKNFRKETCTNTVIPSNSNHPWNIKISAFHSFVQRLITIPMSELN